MREFVNLKIDLDILRAALDKEIEKGKSMSLVREIHTSIKEAEALLSDLLSSKATRN